MSDTLPCGCVIDTVGKNFIIQPCSLKCEYYIYAVELSKQRGNQISYVVDPDLEGK